MFPSPKVIAVACTLVSLSGVASEPVNSAKKMPDDPALVRYYGFEEGRRNWVKQQAGDGDGDLMLIGNSPYGEPNDRRQHKWRGTVVGTEWHQGRFPGTYSIRPGVGRESVMHSRFYKTETGTFTLDAWVRPHEGSGPYLWSGSAYDNGFTLGGSEKHFSWRIATKDGPISIDGPGLKPGIWHHIVASWDAATKTLSLSVDGKLVGEKVVTSDFVPQSFTSGTWSSAPEMDFGGLRIGGLQSTKVGAAKFDIDELAIYSRTLSPEEITKRYESGKPAGTVDEQAVAYEEEMKREAVLKKISLAIPHDTYGYFPVTKPLPVTLAIPANDVLTGGLQADWTLEDIAGKVVDKGTRKLEVSAEKGDEAEVPLSFKECGVYFLDINLKDAAGKVVKRAEYPIGITVPLPPIEEQPETSPLAAHGAVDLEPESPVLGFGAINRFIRDGQKISPGVYDFTIEDELVDASLKRGMEVMFCVNSVPAKWDETPDSQEYNLARYKEHLAQLVRRNKGKVKYWEIVNEPNSGHHAKTLGTGPERATNYVKVLKAAYEVVKKEDPDAQVVAISGCPGFVPCTEEVLAAGGAPYFDIVTIHNYRSAPIQSSARERLIQQVREILTRYGKDCPIWNGEFGVKKPGRPDGRPMTEEAFYTKYASKTNAAYGHSFIPVDMPMVPEPVAAAWTVQTILLDLVDGCSRVFQLAGASNVYPETVDSGEPGEKGVAMAALAEVLMPMKSIERIPLASLRDAGVIVHTLDGRRHAVVFSDDEPELMFRVPGVKEIKGMDILGNPLSWPVDGDGVLHLRANMNAQYLFDVPKGFEQLPLIAVSGDEAFKEGRMAGEITVNNPTGKAATYSLAIEVPKGIEIECPVSVEVPAKGSLKVPFVLTAENLKRGSHELAFALHDDKEKLLAKTQYMINASDAKITIPHLDKPIALEADPAAWKDIPSVKIDEEAYVLSGKPVPGVPWAPQWKGPNDLSFSYRLAWDEKDGICLLIEVTDDQLRAASDEDLKKMFQYDCLELFVDARPVSLRRVGYSPGAEQLMIRPTFGNDSTKCDVLSSAGDVSQFDVQFVGKKSANGYILEGRIRPKPDAPWKLTAGMPFAMDFLIDDADEHLRKTIMGIGYGKLDNSKSTDSWGWFQLGQKTTAP